MGTAAGASSAPAQRDQIVRHGRRRVAEVRFERDESVRGTGVIGVVEVAVLANF
jgi:hypothetical protein